MTSRLHFQTHRAICNDGTKIETKQSCKLAHRGNSHGAGTTCIVGFVVILNENNLRLFSFRRVSTRKRAYRGWCSTGQNILLFNPRFFRALFSKYGNSLNTRSIGESEKERAKREGKRERERGGVSIDRHGFNVDYLFAVHGRQMQHPVRGRLTFNTPVQRCGNSCV